MTNKTISAIDHIITNSIYNNDFKTGIIKADISDNFPINKLSNLEVLRVHKITKKIDICIDI